MSDDIVEMATYQLYSEVNFTAATLRYQLMPTLLELISDHQNKRKRSRELATSRERRQVREASKRALPCYTLTTERMQYHGPLRTDTQAGISELDGFHSFSSGVSRHAFQGKLQPLAVGLVCRSPLRRESCLCTSLALAELEERSDSRTIGFRS